MTETPDKGRNLAGKSEVEKSLGPLELNPEEAQNLEDSIYGGVMPHEAHPSQAKVNPEGRAYSGSACTDSLCKVSPVGMIWPGGLA